MIVLFTDFGLHGPYVGQMKAVLLRAAPAVPVVDLMHDAPAFDAQSSAYLLAALVDAFPAGAVFLCVVDPSVGSSGRRPLILRAGEHWFVGPDNGLFELVARHQAAAVEWREILWRPQTLSASFHGRDLFAPVAAALACGETPHSARLVREPVEDWPEDLPRIIYLDNFGNAMTGLRARRLPAAACLQVAGQVLPRANTFSDLPPGQGFWYENASGLAEIAVNQGHAASVLGLSLRQPVRVV